MLKNNNQKHDFLNQFCQFVSLLCCIKLSIIVQRSYINVLTKRLRKQSTGTHITTSQTSKNRVFCFYFSTLIDRCFLDVCGIGTHMLGRPSLGKTCIQKTRRWGHCRCRPRSRFHTIIFLQTIHPCPLNPRRLGHGRS